MGIAVICAVVIAAGVLVVRKIDARTDQLRDVTTPMPADANAELLRELVRATFLDVHRGENPGPTSYTEAVAKFQNEWRMDGGSAYVGPDLLGVNNDLSDPMDQAIPPATRPDAVMVEPGTAEYPWEKKP